MSENNKSRKIASWEAIAKFAEEFGWFTERVEKNIIVLERRNQRIIARKFSDGKWKVEYYSGRIMDDMSGITDVELAKRELVEMAISK